MQRLARIKTLDTLLCVGQHGFRSHECCSVEPSSSSPTSLQAQNEGQRLGGEHAALMRMQTQPTCWLQAIMSMAGLVQCDEETVVLKMGENITISILAPLVFVVHLWMLFHCCGTSFSTILSVS